MNVNLNINEINVLLESLQAVAWHAMPAPPEVQEQAKIADRLIRRLLLVRDFSLLQQRATTKMQYPKGGIFRKRRRA